MDDPEIVKVSPRTGKPTRGYNRTAAARATPARQTAPTLGRGKYLGRNGEVLTRQVGDSADPYEIPAGLKEKGWDYQWLTDRVYNDTQIVRRHNHQMYQAGWRPVNATGKWNGVFGPPEDTGHIRVGDSSLYERPLGMSEDARADELRKARQLISDRNESLKITGTGKAMPQGFEMSRKYRGTGGDVRISIDQAADVPRPSYDMPDD